MTKEAQRIAIATACGWTGIEDRSEGLMMAPGFSLLGYPPVNPLVGHKEQVPRFLDDLNAMHDAEKVLLIDPFDTPENDTMNGSERLTIQLLTFEEHLDSICFGLGAPWHATAAQRAEAFLRAKGLWVD